jgi:hypothetical protein
MLGLTTNFHIFEGLKIINENNMNNLFINNHSALIENGHFTIDPSN